MVKSHISRAERATTRINNLSDEERKRQADLIVASLTAGIPDRSFHESPNRFSAAAREVFMAKETSFEPQADIDDRTYSEENGWTTMDTQALDDRLNKEAREEEQSLNLCEDCIKYIGLQDRPDWKSPLECDICGETTFCNTFIPEDTLQMDDNYVDKIWKANNLTDKEEGMLVCNFCGTNWIESWGINCQKCGGGNKMVQHISEKERNKNGETIKICGTCSEPWVPGPDGITCVHCDYGVASYCLKDQAKLPQFTAKTLWTPNYDGPTDEKGRTRLSAKEYGTDSGMEGPADLYSVNEDWE
jgi:hypothetical protein